MKPKLIEGIDFYYNEAGDVVLTEKYHLNRGHCCGNGCRHCPYAYEKISSPLREELLKKRLDENHSHQEKRQ